MQPKYKNMHPLILHIAHSLTEIYSRQEAQNIAKLVLTDALGIDLLDLYTGKDIKLSDLQQKKLNEILIRLQNNEPLQYVLGKAQFCELTFHVASGVLIPRQETEELVALIKQDNEKRVGLRILDMGTGSGCIAIALCSLLPDANVSGWDISEEALAQACANNKQLHAQVKFFRQDLFAVNPQEYQFDLIVSNPPYITQKEKQDMDANVLDWEPSLALFVPDDDPLLFYRQIARLGRTMLADGGSLYFEINTLYGDETCEMLRQSGYRKIEMIRDVFGRNRFIRSEK